MEEVCYDNIINPAQMGFRPGYGTEVQIVRLICMMDRVRNQLKRQAEDKVQLDSRTETWLAFIDLRKAYDLVDRDVLLARMLNSKIPINIVVLVAKWLNVNKYSVDGKSFKA